MLTHDCDATNGDSGSPIPTVDGENYGVIGMHVATVGRGDWAFGLAIPPAAFEATLLAQAAVTR